MLNKLSKEIHEGNKSRGFWDEKPRFGEIIALITSELSEALEADRKGKKAALEAFEKRYIEVKKSKGNVELDNNEYSRLFRNYIKDSIEDELADAAIRIFDYCGAEGIDIESHIMYKLKYNATRPYKHGKAY